MSNIEIKMKEISNKISDLKFEFMKLQSAYSKELQDKLGALVGMSFKDENGNYFRIIDVPHVDYDRARTTFNEDRFPVLLCYKDPTICADVGRLSFMTKYSKAAKAEDPVKCIRDEYTEIPEEEFDAELEKAFDEIRSIGKRGDAK